MEILVVDIEIANIDVTEDTWDVENCLICEIGIVNLNLDSGEIIPVFNQTCREDDSPDPESWVFKNTSLTCQMIAESAHFEEFKDGLQEIFNRKPVTSWGHDFDLHHLECPSRCLTIPSKFWDPKRTLTNFLKIPFNSGTGYKWPKVTEACKCLCPNKKCKQDHRGLDDATIEAEIIFKATEKWPILKNEWEQYVS